MSSGSCDGRFGFRGEALAALQQSAVLDITSHDADTGLSWHKVMHRGRTVALHAADQPRTRGTLVRLQDLFGTMPVRRRAMQPAAALQAVRLRLAGIALVRPDVAVKLVDIGRGETVLHTSGSTSDVKATFGRLFGTERAKELHRIRAAASSPEMKLTGYVSTGTHWTPELQVRPVLEGGSEAWGPE